MPVSGIPRALADASRATSAKSSMPNIGYGKRPERQAELTRFVDTQRNTGHASPRVPRGALARPLTRSWLRQDKRLVDVDRVLPRAAARSIGGIHVDDRGLAPDLPRQDRHPHEGRRRLR